MKYDAEGLTIVGTCLLIGVGLALMVRDSIRYRGRVTEPVKSQAPDVTPVDEHCGVVEADELMDAFITDQHCAELDAWIGTTPILPDTPYIAHALGKLTNPR